VKKVKITLNEGSPGRKFFLFPSAEALYVWAVALERNEQVQVDGIQEMVLEPGGFIEAELTGFEYVYDSETTLKNKRLNLIRLAKAHQTQNAAGLEACTYAGWVMGNMLPIKQYSDAHINVRVIDNNESQLDLPSLFNDNAEVGSDEEE
jgi:hypothetical protein